MTIAEELSRVMELLSLVEPGISYNDGSGIYSGLFSYEKEYRAPDIDGKGINPFDEMTKDFLPLLEREFATYLEASPMVAKFVGQDIEMVPASTDFVIRTAVYYKQLRPSNDAYQYKLVITV